MKKNTKRILALFLFALMLFTLICCSQSEDKSAATATNGEPVAASVREGISDETLRVVLKNEPRHLLGLSANYDQSSCHIGFAIYDTLVAQNENGEYIPAVAASWEWLDDLHLQLNLRNDVIAADGTIWNANDLMYSFKKGLSGRSLVYWIMIDINECKVVDDFTFIVGLNQPYPTIINLLATYGMCGIIDESSVEAVGGYEAALHNPKIGTGRYTFDEWAEGQYIKLIRNDDHWDKENLPYYKYVEFTWVSEAATRAMKVQSGEADIAANVSVAESISLKNGTSAYVQNTKSNSSTVLYLNCSIKPLDDVRVREAIFHLVDQQAVIQLLTGGEAKPSETNFCYASPLYKAPPDNYVREVNVDKAKKLLAEAGYPDGFEMRIFGFAGRESVLELIQSNLAAAGIDLKIDIVEIAAGMSMMDTGNYESYYSAAYGFDPVRVINRVDGRLPPSKAGGGSQYYSEELCELIDICKSTTDEKKMKEAYGAVQDYIRENYVLIGLYCGFERYVIAEGLTLTGVPYTDDGYLYVDFVRPGPRK